VLVLPLQQRWLGQCAPRRAVNGLPVVEQDNEQGESSKRRAFEFVDLLVASYALRVYFRSACPDARNYFLSRFLVGTSLPNPLKRFSKGFQQITDSFLCSAHSPNGR